MLCVLRVKAAQVIKSREENRQRNEETIVNSEIEASDDTNGIQEQDIHENITRAVARALIGGVEYSYFMLCPIDFFSNQVDFKRN